MQEIITRIEKSVYARSSRLAWRTVRFYMVITATMQRYWQPLAIHFISTGTHQLKARASVVVFPVTFYVYPVFKVQQSSRA